MMRNTVEELVRLGPLPAEDANVDESVFGQYEELLLSLRPTVDDEEALALLPIFGLDGCYGMAWTLVHLIESAPGWPLPELANQPDNEWISKLRKRAGR